MFWLQNIKLPKLSSTSASGKPPTGAPMPSGRSSNSIIVRNIILICSCFGLRMKHIPIVSQESGCSRPKDGSVDSDVPRFVGHPPPREAAGPQSSSTTLRFQSFTHAPLPKLPPSNTRRPQGALRPWPVDIALLSGRASTATKWL